MTAKRIERAAYVAAHCIVEANVAASELVCPGALRSRAVDTIAEIIRGVFVLQNAEQDEMGGTPGWIRPARRKSPAHGRHCAAAVASVSQ